jgi:hypothetical protein
MPKLNDDEPWSQLLGCVTVMLCVASVLALLGVWALMILALWSAG